MALTKVTAGGLPSPLTTEVSLGDNVKAKFGASDDLQIYHDGSNSYVDDQGTGNLRISSSDRIQFYNAAKDEFIAQFFTDANVSLYHNGTQKFTTTSTGIDVTGSVTCDGLSVDTSVNNSGVLIDDIGGGNDLQIRLDRWTGSASSYHQWRVGAEVDDLTFGYALGTKGSTISERLRIDSSGNVGIGTSSPNVKLQTSDSSGVSTLAIDDSRGNVGDMDVIDFRHKGITGSQIKSEAIEDFSVSANRTSDLQFYTRNNGTISERLRIDSSGNVGIGTSSPSASNTGNSLDVTGVVIARGNLSNHQTSAAVMELSGDEVQYRAYGATAGTGYMTFNVGGGGGSPDSERLRIDSSGNMGLGVVPESSQSQYYKTLDVASGASFYGHTIATDRAYFGSNQYLHSSGVQYYKSNNYASLHELDDGKHIFRVAPSGTADSAISWTTAMTIDNGGGVLVGTSSYLNTTNNGGATFYPQSFGRKILQLGHTDSNNRVLAEFYGNSSTSLAGYIACTGSSTSYLTSSDYRLKENVVPMTGSIDRLKALKPSRFNFIADADTTVDGFLAHEAGEVVPEAISGEKDAMRTEEYEVTPALGEVFTPAIEEVTEERQVMETIETGTYVNLAGETITETSEVGQTIEVTTTVIERQDIEGVMTEVEVEKVSQEPVMETVVTTEAVAEVILESNVEKPEEGNWRETTPAEMGTREVPDYQGIDQAKLTPLLVSALQEAVARIEQLENA